MAEQQPKRNADRKRHIRLANEAAERMKTTKRPAQTRKTFFSHWREALK